MNITSTNIDSVSLRLTVAVEESDYKAKVTEDLKKIGRTHQIPGFRKGHISIKDLERRFGKQVTSDVINQVVYEAVMNYIRDNKLNVLGQPLPVEVKELDLKTQKEFTFEYDLAVAPELDVEVDKNITVPYYNIEVTDAMIDEQDAAFRKRFGAQVSGEEFEKDALVKGSIMQLDENGSIKEGDGAIQVVSGILAPMYFADKDEAAKFEGKKVGDKVVFNPRKATGDNVTELSSMFNIDKERVAEIQGDFEMAISEIIVVKPAELGEEFYTNVFGKDKVHNEEEYRNAVKELIEGELSGNSDMIFRWEARKVYMEKYGNMELPAELLKKWLIMRNEDLNEENVEESYQRMESDLKWQLILDKIVAKLDVKVEKDDLLEFAKGLAARQFAQYGMTNMDDETITKYAENILADKNYIGRIQEQVGEVKTFNALKEAVALAEETVSLDKFKEIASKL
ncbi:MAG: trigger factor [Paramuribaculum sp.]|nr:trigger factor [Paramuribaculum sp.]